ncbi:hypothetical protein Ddc_16716 [Ditylenchus destructor]|nr:hypothetical protein Ddc_16716 [Ditylenchus destructor]
MESTLLLCLVAISLIAGCIAPASLPVDSHCTVTFTVTEHHFQPHQLKQLHNFFNIIMNEVNAIYNDPRNYFWVEKPHPHYVRMQFTRMAYQSVKPKDCTKDYRSYIPQLCSKRGSVDYESLAKDMATISHPYPNVPVCANLYFTPHPIDSPKLVKDEGFKTSAAGISAPPEFIKRSPDGRKYTFGLCDNGAHQKYRQVGNLSLMHIQSNIDLTLYTHQVYTATNVAHEIGHQLGVRGHTKVKKTLMSEERIMSINDAYFSDDSKAEILPVLEHINHPSITPIWNCPLHHPPQPPLAANFPHPADVYMYGVYGVP